MRLQNSFNSWKIRIRIMWWSQTKWLFIWMTLEISSYNFQKNSQRSFFVRATSRSQTMSWSKKAQTIICSNFMMIRLIDVQSSKSRWRRLTSRQTYWFWIESRRRQSDEDDFSSRYDSTKKLHIRCDNRQILCVLKKEMLKLDTKLKHVDIHKHWMRQEIQTNRISVSWCSTAEMSRDVTTPNTKNAEVVY